MASLERQDSIGSATSEGRRHRQHSSTDSGRPPMWDSSDPDRAPPPLPLNPRLGSPTRPNTSAHVAAAAQALFERARENAGFNTYTLNPREERSPEKSPTRTPQNKRLQTLQTGSLSGLKTAYENQGFSDWDGSRPGTPFSFTDGRSSPARPETPTPTTGGKDMFKDETPQRSPTRPALRSILSENTPPSATMLAIQNMPYRDSEAPLRDITNASTLPVNSSTPIHTPYNMDTIHAQIQKLTEIAQNLQKEMSALSRRSKDNATDLVSLKEATRSRDEDIRKALRELMSTARVTEGGYLTLPSRLEMSRPGSPYTTTARSVDERAFKPAVAPRRLLPSLIDTASDRSASPLPHAADVTASVIILEKIIQDMATKESQDHVLRTISDLLESTSEGTAANAKKFDELAELIRKEATSQVLVLKDPRPTSISDLPPRVELDFAHSPHQMPKDRSTSPHESHPEMVISDELIDILRNIKDSTLQGGGLTAEVKALVRELRGEVLVMGRELGAKLDEIELPQDTAVIRHEPTGVNVEEVSRVVDGRLAHLKQYMEEFFPSRLQPYAEPTSSRAVTNGEQVYAAVKQAISEHHVDIQGSQQGSQLDQEAILTAVREAYEAYKPEIEVQQFGLDREEILECLKEGLVDYQNSKPDSANSAANRTEVLDAVREGLQNFNPPAAVVGASDLKDEILLIVRECLKAQVVRGEAANDIDSSVLKREDVLDVIREGFLLVESHSSKTAHVDTDNLEQAVKAALSATQTPSSAYGDRILNSMQDIVDRLQNDLKQRTVSIGQNSNTDEGDRSEELLANREALQRLKMEIEKLSNLVAEDRSPGKNESIDSELFTTLNERLLDHLALLNKHNPPEHSGQVSTVTMEEFDHLREAILDANASHKDVILEFIQDGLQHVQERGLAQSMSTDSNLAVVELLKDEFDSLKLTLAAPVLQYANAGDKEEILSKLQQFFEDTKVQLATLQTNTSDELLEAMKEEVGQLRERLEASTAKEVPAANVELLQTIRDGLGGLRNLAARDEEQAETAETLEDIRDELEGLRDTLISTLEKGGRANADEIIEAVKLEIDEVKKQIEEKVPDMTGALTVGEAPNAVSEALSQLKEEVVKLGERPIEMDMTVSYEILDMLKDGLSGIRADVERMRSERNLDMDGEIVLAEAKKHELEKMEVMLSRLQIKVEAMDQNMQSSMPAASAAVDATLRDLHASITSLIDREALAEPTRVSKEDTAAIETLLQNTKAKLDDQIIPILDASVTKEHVETLEALVNETNDAVQSMSIKLTEEVSTRDDIAALGAILTETTTSLTNMRDQLCGEDGSRAVSRDDMDVIILSCATIKEKIDKIPTADTAPVKEDLYQLRFLMEKLHTSQDALKQRYENDIEVTAQAFDDRKKESKHTSEQLSQLRTLVEESMEELESRLKRGNDDVRTLDVLVRTIEEKVDNAPNAIPVAQDIKEFVTEEFAQTHSALDGLRENQDLKSTILLEKQDETQAFILAEVTNKLQDCFNEVLTRAEEQQASIKQITDAVGERSVQQEGILSSSKAMVEDLKLTIDTFGASITTISPALVQATEKMDDDAKTVFARIEDLGQRLDHAFIDAKTHHQLTHEEVAKSVAAVTGVHEEVLAFQPRFMDTLASLMSIAAEHFELSKKHAQNSSTKMDEIKTGVATIPLPRIEAPPAPVPIVIPPITEKYDDTTVQSKLDQLLDHFTTTTNAQRDQLLDHLTSTSKSQHDELLDHLTSTAKSQEDQPKISEIHQQVMATAAEVSAFVAFQNKIATARHNTHEREANEMAIEVNQLLTERDELEAKVINLRQTKESLASDISSYITERDSLMNQKVRMTAEVSSLEMALKLRREELAMMDERADRLERRIIEGVMDHSRTLLLIKSSRKPHKNLKRVTSNASHGTTSTATQSTAAAAGVNMALRSGLTGRRAQAPASTNDTGRRIHSLGQITSNVRAGGMGVASKRPNPPGGLTSLKRTQTDRNHLRKSTWAASPTTSGALDKENAESLVDEESNDDENQIEAAYNQSTLSSVASRSHFYGRQPMARNQRVSSYGTTTNPSEYSYAAGTGSYLTGTESYVTRTESQLDRRSSYGSTVRSRVGVEELNLDGVDGSEEESEIGADEEEDGNDGARGTGERNVGAGGPDQEEEYEQEEEEQDYEEEDAGEEADDVAELGGMKDLIPQRRDGYDSGLGSDLPTAALSDTTGSARGSYFGLLKGKWDGKTAEHA